MAIYAGESIEIVFSIEDTSGVAVSPEEVVVEVVAPDGSKQTFALSSYQLEALSPGVYSVRCTTPGTQSGIFTVVATATTQEGYKVIEKAYFHTESV